MTSFRAFAKAIGVSHQAVSKGARSGRLSASLGRDRAGRPCIADEATARREWRENASQTPTTCSPKPVSKFPPADDECPGVDVEGLVFDLIEFVLVNHLPGAILRRHGGRVDQFDPRALRDFLQASRGPS